MLSSTFISSAIEFPSRVCSSWTGLCWFVRKVYSRSSDSQKITKIPKLIVPLKWNLFSPESVCWLREPAEVTNMFVQFCGKKNCEEKKILWRKKNLWKKIFFEKINFKIFTWIHNPGIGKGVATRLAELGATVFAMTVSDSSVKELQLVRHV